jgi:hypothetical protein
VRQKLLEGEWLDQIVVCPGVEPGDAVVDALARGEHQDRCPVPRLTQSATDLKAVDTWHGHVEDDYVRGLSHQRVDGGRTVRGRLHVVTVDHECPADRSKNSLFVVDNEHS